VTVADTWAVIPVKPLSEAKSRLKPVMDGQSRSQLAARLLRRTLNVVAGESRVQRVVITSRDARALLVAKQLGALPLPEAGGRGLNFALSQAAAVAAKRGAQSLLIIASDLPLLSPEDLHLLFSAAEDSQVVVAPDRHDTGTNALFLRPPERLQPAFGSGSYERHLKQARAAGIEPFVVRSLGLGFDLDVPSDYEDLQSLAPDEWGEAALMAGLSLTQRA
jgi:2-phospho-L-lactate guanylyltransferase